MSSALAHEIKNPLAGIRSGIQVLGGRAVKENEKLLCDSMLHEIDRVIGLKRLKAIHLNDSKNPFESHKDRHEKIGEGSLGLDAFVRIINHPALRDLPFYLETPNELDGYAK